LEASGNKYVYVTLSVSESLGLQIASSDYHTSYRQPRGEPLIWDGDLSLPRAVLHHFGVSHGLPMFMALEVLPEPGWGHRAASRSPR
jgi:D-glycero-alpha-D-manno-heptose-7-phosphate kinase